MDFFYNFQLTFVVENSNQKRGEGGLLGNKREEIKEGMKTRGRFLLKGMEDFEGVPFLFLKKWGESD